MKKITLLFLVLISLTSCFEDKDDVQTEIEVTVSFGHYWDDTEITNTGSEPFPFTTASLTKLGISKLRYLISNVTLTKPTGEKIILQNYNLITLFGNQSFTSKTTIPLGSYSNLSFTFGFNNDDNYLDYSDLNAATWNLPVELGGGYHFMQLEGQFLNSAAEAQAYEYHVIRAVDTSLNPLAFQDTFFEVNLGPVEVTKNAAFNISMNVAEWFKTPHTWDLNALNSNLKPNFNAQIMMYDNGKDVFTLR